MHRKAERKEGDVVESGKCWSAPIKDKVSME